ncbi:MAG TPA: hypothetical protein VMO47_11385 [Rhodothermales bacterium]|nr:hypothetical protein [Rhodothermales bacterium]
MGMQQMIYYAAATLIGFVVILLMSSLLLRGQETSVDTTQILRAKNYLYSAIQNIELDFRNLGGGKDDVSTIFPLSAIDLVGCSSFAEYDCKFRFYGRADSTSADSSLIEYFWRQSGTETIDTDLSGGNDELVDTQMYTLRRVVDGQQRFAIDRVSRFDIGTFDADGKLTANPSAFRQIEIDLRVLVPTTQADEALEEVRWRSVFRPVNLTRE